jgi:aspartyl-tRNA(Asn)/glutamyl-tRNA(Gln) amidotransferase subunit C
MGTFDKSTIQHLKKLCRIACSAEEEALILNSLQKILSHIDQLNQIDTTYTEPCKDVMHNFAKPFSREDVVADLMPRDLFLKNAPDQIAGMIRTPPILKSL